MFNSYLKIAFRNLFKRKAYSVLNILGLSIGIIGCLLLFQYVSYEKNYDNFQEDNDRIVRVRLDAYQQGKLAWQSAGAFGGIAAALKMEFPEVEEVCRVFHSMDGLLMANEKKGLKAIEPNVYYADPSAMSILDIKLKQGNPATVLNAPNKIILNETLAKKYFGNENPVGQQLISRSQWGVDEYEVAGVFEDYPANSHLALDFIASMSTMEKLLESWGEEAVEEAKWRWNFSLTYLQLKPGTDYRKLEKNFPSFCEQYLNQHKWAKENKMKYEMYLLPLKDIHLHSIYTQEAAVNGDHRRVGFLFLLAFIIMGIAWVNYVNLSTARSVERAKEVGVRKVLGALRSNLVVQFLFESFLFNIISLVIGLLAAWILLPVFTEFTGHPVSRSFTISGKYWFIFLGFFFGGTLLSGIYPAFVLSGFLPVKVLKGAFKNTSKGLVLRKALIVFQFVVSNIFIAGTIIVYKQVNYMRNQDLGFNKEQTLVLNAVNSVIDSVYRNRIQPFKNDLLQVPGVKSIAASLSIMGKEINWVDEVKKVDVADKQSWKMEHNSIDYDYIPAFGIKIVAGRNFSKDYNDYQKSTILNETAAKLLGYFSPQDAIGKWVAQGIFDSLQIVGIVADFHQQGLQNAIQPELFLCEPYTRGYYAVKIGTGNVSNTITALKTKWDKHFPDDPFSYFFLDEFYDRQYKSSNQFGQVFALFSWLAILVACFGILGLSTYNILQRIKEIGIRKILGASVENLVLILSKDFLKLIGIAFVIAIPVTWLIMHRWLQDFAYRINISWWIFLLAGTVATVIALGTISFQVIKAAMTRPVKSLKTE